jgi:hypothetical protein
VWCATAVQVMELMEGGDLRRALWQNQEEYAWDRRGAQVLLPFCRREMPCYLVTAPQCTGRRRC